MKPRSTNQKRNRTDYQLLPDEPIPADRKQDIKFGHTHIAQVVSELVEKANPPFTIGLFGKWGTGKTTILGLIEREVKEKGITYVHFDVWKYEKDSLRRQFLIQCDEQLVLQLGLKETLSQSITEEDPSKERLTIDWKLLLNKVSIVFALITVLLLAFQAFTNKMVINSLISTSLFGYFITVVLEAIRRTSVVRTIHRTDSAEGFEDIFYNKILPKVKSQKMLVVIDNLDRTTHNKATDLLSDIKTFLGKDEDGNKAVFLIACDEEAIRRHLEKSNFDDPPEYLRKFFNTSIKIPRFLGVELDQYTRELLEKTNIEELKNNYELEWLITYTFRDNPREIKQFINTLISHYLLAMRMEKSNQIITKGTITKKIGALAKLLIIRQKFPNVYQAIEKAALSRLLTWQVLEVSPEKIYDDIFVEQEAQTRILEKEKQNFVQFVKETNHINIPDLLIFVRLRQSEFEQKLPGWEEYVVAAEDKKIEDAKNLFSQFIEKKVLGEFDSLSRDYARRAKTAEAFSKLWAFGSTTIVSAGESISNLTGFVNELTPNFPTQNELLDRLDDYPPKKIFDSIFPLARQYNQRKIATAYISLLGLRTDKDTSPLSEKQALALMETISQHKDHFVREKEVIRKGLEDYFYTERFLVIFVNNKLEEVFITDKAKEKFIDSIVNDDLKNLDTVKRKLNLLARLDVHSLLDKTLQKINELMQFEIQQGVRTEQRLLLAEWLREFLSSYKDAIEQLQNKTVIETLSGLLGQWYSQDGDPKNRLIYIRTMRKLERIEGNARASAIENVVRGYVSTLPPQIIGEFSEQELKELISLYPQEFRTASITHPEFFYSISKFLPKSEIDQIIIGLVNSQPAVVPEILKSIDYELENPAQVVSAMLDRAPSFGNQSLEEEYYDAVARMKCGNDAGQIDKFYRQLLNMKSVRPDVVRKYSGKRFFNSAQRKDLKS